MSSYLDSLPVVETTIAQLEEFFGSFPKEQEVAHRSGCTICPLAMYYLSKFNQMSPEPRPGYVKMVVVSSTIQWMLYKHETDNRDVVREYRHSPMTNALIDTADAGAYREALTAQNCLDICAQVRSKGFV